MKLKLPITQVRLMLILILGLGCTSFSQDIDDTVEKNEIGLLVTLDNHLINFYQPQFGLSYSRLMYKRNLFIFGNVLIRQYNRNNERNRDRLYEIGIEYRWFPLKKIPFNIGTQVGFMNSNWLDDRIYSNGNSYVDYTRNYLINLTPMITYGNKLKVALGYDLGYGKHKEYRESTISGVAVTTYDNISWATVVSKQVHLKLCYSF